MRIFILIFMIVINLFSIVELGRYDDSDFIQLISLRVIIALVTFLLSIAYILVRGSRTMVVISIITTLIALSHFVFLIYVNL